LRQCKKLMFNDEASRKYFTMLRIAPKTILFATNTSNMREN